MLYMRKIHFLLLVFALLIFIPLAAQETPPTVLAQTLSLAVADVPLDAVAINPSGNLVATGGRDHQIRLFNLDTRQQPALILASQSDRITALTFSPDGTLLASASADRTVAVWNIEAVLAGSTTFPIQIIAYHQDVVTSVAFMRDSTGRLLLASGGRDGMIWLGDPLTGAQITVIGQFESPVWALAFSPSDAEGNFTLASTAEDGTIWLWGMGNTSTLRRLTGHQGPAMSLTFNATGSLLASGGIDGTLRLWDMTLAEPTATILTGHIAPITGVAFQENLVLTTSLDGTVRAWDVESGTALVNIPGTGFPLTGLALHGAELASIGTEGTVNLWEVDTQAAAQIVNEITRANDVVRQNALPDAPAAPQIGALPTPTQAARTVSNQPTLSIPVANIFSAITTFPLNGVSWAIDPWEQTVGYLQGTAWLDETGNIALGGHSSYPNGNPGIFAGLYNVNVGDVIILSEGRIERRYVVIDKRTVRYDDVSVVYPTTDNRLTLITCDLPSLDAATGTYLDRLVVIARLVG